MNKEERIGFFSGVLGTIKDENVRRFGEKLLEDADDYFFTEPASSSGKYHPKYALGNGGLSRHSIAVAMILHDMLECDCYEFTDNEKDLLICAAIVHDIKKYGEGKVHTVKNHPELAEEYILSESESFSGLSQEDVRFMADAVRTHMGQWGSKKPETDAQKLVHLSDCLSSKKWLEVQFDNPDLFNVEGKSKQKPSKSVLPENAGDYVLSFGKFKGKMIKEVERAYLEFIVTKFEDKEEDVVKMARKFLVEGK